MDNAKIFLLLVKGIYNCSIILAQPKYKKKRKKKAAAAVVVVVVVVVVQQLTSVMSWANLTWQF
jgi:hypothetical protein